MPNHRDLISIVIPTYKAEGSITELYNAIINNLRSIPVDFEILFVDDWSPDSSWNLISDLCKKDSHVKGIRLARNYGEHYAITAGIDHAIGNYVVVMACDLQDDPNAISKMYLRAKEGFDVIFATRVGLRYSPLKIFYSKIFYSVLNFLSDAPFNGRASNFVLLSPLALTYFRKHRESLRTFRGIICKMNLKGADVDVFHQARYLGQSNYSFVKSLRLAGNHLIAYSDKLFEYVLLLGFIVATSSFVYGTVIFVRALLGFTSVPGWSSIIVATFFLGGTIITILGFLGIYIKKCFEEVMKRPIYFVRERKNIAKMARSIHQDVPELNYFDSIPQSRPDLRFDDFIKN